MHIFEIKSVNISNDNIVKIDSDKYKEKIEELKKCYKQASVLTGYLFYLPVLKDDVWHITQFQNGEENNLTKEQFIDYLTVDKYNDISSVAEDSTDYNY